MNKHTPGPWRIGTKYRNDIFVESGDKLVARTIVQGFGENQSEANAQLIAAAPDLLKELKAMTALFLERYPAKGLDGESQARIDAANAAIKKATGSAA